MTFVYPLFLWALAAVAIPVIIHLFNFRRYKKVYFTNVKFLKELQQESKSKSRLRELLVLLCRCLAIICLVLAFSQPVLNSAKTPVSTTGARAVSLYIDNSFSMENVNRQGPLLEIARTKARQVVNAFGNADRFQIITNDFEGRHQRFHTREDALNVLDEIKISSSVRSFSDVYKRQAEFLKSGSLSQKKIYAFSDGQRSTFDLEKLESDTTIDLTILPISANKVNNVVTDSCWFETPFQQKGFIQKLHARILNKGTGNIEAGSARLFINNRQIAISTFSAEASGQTEIVFTFESREDGFNYGAVKIEDYPITFDDELFFTFNSRVSIGVCLVNGKNAPGAFSSLFNNDSIFRLTELNEQTIDYGAFKKADVIVLNQLSSLSSGLTSELIKFTQQGGAIVIIPNSGASLYNDALAQLKLPLLGQLDSLALKAENIEFGSGFYTGVFEKVNDRMNLPVVNKHYRSNKITARNFECILTLQNGDCFFGSSVLNNAALYMFLSPLEQAATNFVKHALFVPTLYQLCFSSLRAPPLFYKVRTNVAINIKNDQQADEQPPHIISANKDVDIIPEMRVMNNSLSLFTRDQVNVPGFYNILRGDARLQPLAFNYSRVESDLESYSVADLESIIARKGLRNVSVLADTGQDISSQVVMGAEGKKMWKLFLILAILFIIIEVALLRLLK